MGIELKKITLDEKETLKNLMQFYFYDFSEITGADVTYNGSFGVYPYLNDYFLKQSHEPYFLMEGETIAGFALVKQLENSETYAIGEFFVLRKFRRCGAGLSAAIQLFKRHPGEWEVFQMEKNTPAQAFWRKAIAEVTNGHFEEKSENGRVTQNFTVK